MPDLRQSAPPLDLVETLRRRAEHEPDRGAYAFLADGETETESLTFGMLDQAARSVGAELQRRGAADRPVLLVYPAGLPFMGGFWGCLYGGAIAVPAPAPGAGRNERVVARLEAIARDAKPTLVLTCAAAHAQVMATLSGIPALRDAPILSSDSLPQEAARTWTKPGAYRDRLAYLQYTSGSTGTPKGVMVTHDNVLANVSFLHDACGFSRESRLVNWVPTFHDQGLIYAVCAPVCEGFPAVHMSPHSFVEKPHRWLLAISKYEATHAGGPNFCYELCVRKVRDADRDTLDLRSWQNAYNASEPVRYETMQRFAAAFATSGFRNSAFQACYGLAEATLRVAAAPFGVAPKTCTVDASVLEQGRAVEVATRGAQREVTLVGHGPLNRANRRVRIVRATGGAPCDEGEVGEIWVAGPDVAVGYWKRPEESEQTFRVRIDGDPDRYLRTGDLGFHRHGELYITGRLKDVIVIRGANYYPQDIEHTVERAAPSLRPGFSVAIALDVDGVERLVVIAEIDRRFLGDGGTAEHNTASSFQPEPVFGAIRQALLRHHELQAHEIVLIRPGTLPKTSSGKAQRSRCRALHLTNAFDVVARTVRARCDPF